ncbi:MAG: MCE family protein [Sedimentisphaerales bacterium]|nr:MCE family protein [Sedimentisphaerales bacterium]
MSDYETTQKRRNIVVGFFVILGVCALVWLIFKFGDLPTFVTKLDSFQVFVQFPTASGVQRDTPVQFCGYQIGRVTKVMAPEIRKEMSNGKKTDLEYYQTVVVISIDKSYKTIPSNVEVKLMTRGLGSSFIDIKQTPGKELVAQDPNNPETRFLMDKMWLQGSAGMTSEFFPEESQKKLEELINGVNELVANANDIIGDQKNKENFKQIMANLNNATQQLDQTVDEIRKFAATGTSTLEKLNVKMDEAVDTFVKTSDDFRTLARTGTTKLESFDQKAERLVTAMVVTSEQLNVTMGEFHSVLEKINTGEGSAARLINDGKFYENLLENTEQLQKLLEEMEKFTEEWKNKKIKITLF